MGILFVYPVILVGIGVLIAITIGRRRVAARADPPWNHWARGEHYRPDPRRRHRRVGAVLGGVRGVILAVPVMALIGLAGTARGATRER